MKSQMDGREVAIGMFYGAGVILGTAAFFTIGLLTGQWAPAFFACIGGGIGFGLILHGILSMNKEHS